MRVFRSSAQSAANEEEECEMIVHGFPLCVDLLPPIKAAATVSEQAGNRSLSIAARWNRITQVPRKGVPI